MLLTSKLNCTANYLYGNSSYLTIASSLRFIQAVLNVTARNTTKSLRVHPYTTLLSDTSITCGILVLRLRGN